MTLQPAAILATGILAVVASSMNVPRAGIDYREGAPFIIAKGDVTSKAGPLVATAYGCANVYQGTKFLGQFGGFGYLTQGPIYVPRGYSIANCPVSSSNPGFPISGHEGT